MSQVCYNLPPSIVDAASAMLKPFGVDFTALLKDQHQEEPQSIAVPVKPKYLTVADAIKYTGIGRWTLYRAMLDGKIKGCKLTPARGGKLLYDLESIDHWLQNRQITPPPAESEKCDKDGEQ